jgi:hypothetical protein
MESNARIEHEKARAQRPPWPKCIGILLSAILAILTLLPIQSRGQQVRLPDTNLVHWAYAAAFGTGVYKIGEARTFVFRFRPRITRTFSFENHLGGRQFYFEIRLPVTIGLHEFSIGELLSPDIRQVSFTPGIMLQVPLRSNWAIQLFGNIGGGAELGDARDAAWIYWGGINSRLAFSLFKTEMALLNGIGSFGFNPRNGDSEAISTLITGLEWNPRLGKMGWGGEQLYLNTQALYYYYFEGLDVLWNPDRDPASISWEWELGLSLSKKTPFRIWFLNFQRLGLGYRFSPNSSGIRIFTSAVFY